MIKTEPRISNETRILQALLAIYERIRNNGDLENAKKILELIKKIHDQEYTIGFCGHFSAGKSSMINELMGEEILPSSPIPTSANIVKIKAGEEFVRIYYRLGEIVEYPVSYDYDLIKSYCKNGEEISLLEISHPTNQLPNGVTVMDTPGIDSTDDEHQKSTMSALHLADLILYVMDYNHVQSELNFKFTKMLKDEGKTVYLIINQIDKHRDAELSFEEFQNGVHQAFKNWNVEADGIFYTSVRYKDLVNNELESLKSLIAKTIENKKEYLLTSIKTSAYRVIQEHRMFLREITQHEQQKYKNVISSLKQDELAKIDQIVLELENELQMGSRTIIEAEKEFKQELESILNSAYMMPYETRELAKLFLESHQPNFKVGLFFAKAKTEQEKKNRLNRFYENLRHIVENQLERHLSQFIINFLKMMKVTDPALLKAAQTLSVTFDASLIQSIVKKGAGVNGDYVLTYTSDVANEIKRLYRNECLNLFEKIKLELTDRLKTNETSIIEKLNEYKQYQEATHKLQKLQDTEEDEILTLQNMIEEKVEVQSDIEVDQLIYDHFTKLIRKENMTLVHENSKHEDIHDYVEVQSDEKQLVVKNEEITTSKVTNIVSNLRKTSDLVRDITGLTLISQQLLEKAARLEGQNFTIALFGAFSAGKSSFANALMGEAVLPVSPNPTTATINKIVPITKQNPHGTVKVKLKTSEQLLQDINHSLKVFGLGVSTLDEALEVIKRSLSQTNIGAKEKTHYNFLKAVEIGFSNIAEKLGTILQVGLEGFSDFVAKEEKACFVEWIELYYDCPLTQKGITLVDTPGADSVNARHTGVAFEYIKNADAVLFVTYYNHAFSKADREFLIQLGRVKDTFAMDKMFFIVNAADLASSKKELNEVVQYVGSQLVTYGIRQPRLYPISSQMALKEKQNERIENNTILPHSGMVDFEADFHHFIIEELTEMAIQSGVEDMKRIIHILGNYISSAKESNEVKATKIANLQNEQQSIQSLVNHYDNEIELNAIKQEIEELIYYINQRIFLRYPDIFKESFNPSVLREDVANVKITLKKCLTELIEFIGHDLAQEMRATSLRVEKFMKTQLEDMFKACVVKSQRIQKELELTPFQVSSIKTLEHPQGLSNLSAEDAKFKKVLNLYKNAKSFFENNEKKIMCDELEKLLKQPVLDYLEESKERFAKFYEQEFVTATDMLKQHIILQIKDYYEGMMSVLENKIDIEKIETVKIQIEGMIE